MRFGIFYEHRLPRPRGPRSEHRAPLRDLAGRALVTARDSLRGRGQAGLRRVVGGMSDARLEQVFGSSQAQRAVFAMMTRRFDPARTAGFEGAIAYDVGLADGTRRCWVIEVRGGQARVYQDGDAADAALTIGLALADLVRVLTTAGSFYPLILDGRMTVAGDLALANRLAEMFGTDL
jgi:alkyl sulfatase BDS1-like metallo-beta-lactamase superfamily hydrolase